MLHTWALVFGYIYGRAVLFPPGPQHAVHTDYVKYDNTFTCKRICWGPGGGTMLKKYFSIFYMFNTKSGHFGPKIKQGIV